MGKNNYFESRTIFFKQLIRKIIDVPVIEIPWFATIDSKFKDDAKHMIISPPHHNVDLARDLKHPGIKTNKLNADLILDYIQKENLFST